MHRGHIKLWRKITEWSWYHDAPTLALFIHLLIKSNHKDTVFMGHPVPKGSCVCGYFALHQQTGLTIQQIRTCFERLKSTSDITVKSTNKFSIVCIVNYNEYQSKSTSRLTGKSTNHQQTINKQATTSKEAFKNVKNDKKRSFRQQYEKQDTESEGQREFRKLAAQIAGKKMLV